MTVAVIIGIVALICLTAMTFFVTVSSRQSVSDAFRALERIESRHKAEMETVLDRLMTIKWEDYIVARSAEDSDEGGFITPAQQKEGEAEGEVVVEAGKWGHLNKVAERLGLKDNEEELLREDFPEDFETDEQRRRRQAEERDLV